MNPALLGNRRTLQPQTPVALDRNNPLTRGLILSAYNFPLDYVGSPRNWVTGSATGSSGGVSAFATGPHGITPKLNGTSDAPLVTLDLSPYAAITISWWGWLDSVSNNNRGWLEYGFYPQAGAATGNFALTPDSAGTTFFVFDNSTGSNSYQVHYPQPSLATWHHHAIQILSGSSAAAVFGYWIDAIPQTLSSQSGTGASTFKASQTLRILGRDPSNSVWTPGRVANFNVHNRLLTTAEIKQLYLNSQQLFSAPGGRENFYVSKSISGQVTLSGVAQAGAVVFLYRRSTGALLAATTADGSGNYSFSALVELSTGAYEVVVQDATNTYNLGRLDRMTAG